MRQKNSNKRLTILTDLEKSAIYDLPQFTDSEREEFLSLTELEQSLVFSRSDPAYQLYCALQISYFKAKQAFFNFTWNDVSKEDADFILIHYFTKQHVKRKPVHEYEYYTQRKLIAELFEYRLWSSKHTSSLFNQIQGLTKRDATPNFILMEILAFLKKQKIVRPGYSTLQTIISNTLSTERKRLAGIIKKSLTKQEKDSLQNLLIQEQSLSDLAALKQDPKDFKLRMMEAERTKLETIKPLYKIAKKLLPTLNLSQQNILYYATLVNYYTIYDLRKKIKEEQTYLYLLCYIWQRYQQFNDNLINAFGYHLKQFEDETKEDAKEKMFHHQKKERSEKPIVGKLLEHLVDDDYHDDTHLGIIRKKAFTMMPKDEIRNLISQLCKRDVTEIDFRWEFIDKLAHRFKTHLRPFVLALDFSSTAEDSPWLAAINWLKDTFTAEQSLNQCSFNECPPGSIPKRLQSFLLQPNADGQSVKLNSDRYEFWIYRQLRKRLNAGELYLDDSIHHRSLNHELASLNLNEKDIKQLDVPALKSPIKNQIDSLFSELDELWITFNSELKDGKLKHLRYDEKHKTLHLCKSKEEQKDKELQHRFYSQLPLCDITDVLRFVHDHCRYLSALTPIQTRYCKQPRFEKSLIATIIAQAMNHGNLNMAEISNIHYDHLQETLQSCVRLPTLKASNDLISNDIARMAIFPYYSIDIAMLYSGVDGQKFEVKTPTTKARHSKKYFGKVRGVVAYTLLSNHISLQTQLISPHEHESYYTFDIWNNNTSDVVPDVVTGDMHCINKANFGIMHWFGVTLIPRFTDIQAQIKHLYSGNDLTGHTDWLINPVGQIDRDLIEEEWPNLQRIIALLATKEISQSTLIKKLCTYSSPNRTRKALF